MNRCENCEQEHSGEYGSGRFCSSKCAKGFSTKNKRQEINEKVSKTLKNSGNDNVILECVYCKETFIRTYNRRHRKFCSNKCSAKYKAEDVNFINKIRDTVNENVKNGPHLFNKYM